MRIIPKLPQLGLFLLVLHARSCWAAETVTGELTRVGNAGDPARVSIQGAQVFTEADIRRALQTDLDYLIASRPGAILAQCLAALEERVCAGYRENGFPTPVVQARFDPGLGRVVASVTEGPRYYCGAIQVTGLRSITAAEFTRRLAEKLAPPAGQVKAGAWKPGLPASFTPETLANCAAGVSNTFAGMGRFVPNFKVEIQPHPAAADAALAVIVTDEGPAALLRDVEVVGNNKNPDYVVVGFLGLSKGIPVTQDLVDGKARALTQTGRFIDSSITPIVLGRGEEVSLRINLLEHATFPPLGQPSSREEATLLRLVEWLMSWESRPEDLVLCWSPRTGQSCGLKQIELTVSLSGGITARGLGTSPDRPELQDLYSFVATTDALNLFAQVHRRKLCIPVPAGHSGILFLNLEACTNCPSKFNLTVGAGLNPSATEPGWRLHLRVLPAALIDLVYRPGAQAMWQGGILTLRSGDLLLRIEEGTGRLLELASMLDRSGSGARTPGTHGLTLRFQAGAYAKAAAEIAAKTGTHPDSFQPRRPLGSSLGFIASEITLADSFRAQALSTAPFGEQDLLASALEKLLKSSFLDPVQDLLNRNKAPRDHEKFTIPSRHTESRGFEQMFQEATIWSAGHASELVPQGSWLHSLLRESALAVAGKAATSPRAIADPMPTNSIGPIGCYLALHALLWSKQDEGPLVQLCLSRLATADFRRDYELLLDTDSVLTRSLANLFHELGALTPQEADALAEALPPEGADLVRRLAWATRRGKDLPVVDAVGPILERWWETSARRTVESDFRFHSRASAPAPSAR